MATRKVGTVVVTNEGIKRNEYLEVLDVIEKYVADLRRLRRDHKSLDEALDIIRLMRTKGMLSLTFRNRTFKALEELLDEMYVEING